MTGSSLRRGIGWLLGAAVFVATLVMWEWWARSNDSFLVPAATTVLERAWHEWPTTSFLETVGSSLKRLAAGFGLGSVVGVAIGLVMGSSRAVLRTLEPFVDFLRSIPPIAIVPAAIVVLGLDDATRITVIAFGVTFPVLIHTVDGVRAVSPEARDTATMLHVGPVERIYRLYLPTALPSIVAGLRVALSIGIVVLVLSELVVGGEGLGGYILLHQSQFNVAGMYAGILFLGLLGYVLNGLFLVAERRFLAWHHGAVGASAP